MDTSGIKRAQSRLASLAKIIAADEFQDGLATDKADWEATFGVPCPESIEELARWAARLGVDSNYILRGEWTEADLFPLIEGFLQRREETGDRAKDESVVATPLQQKILASLDGQALKKDALAAEVCAGEGTRLYRKGGIKELMKAGLVANKRGVGYYRPDTPPEGLIIKRVN